MRASTLIISILLFLLINESYAQEDSNPKTLTIENPYSVKHTNWLKKKGVNIESYDLSNDDVNARFQDILYHRSTSKTLGIIGGGLILLTFVVNSYAAALSNGLSNNYDKSYEHPTTLYYVGGALMVGSVVYSEMTTKRINQIKARYELDY